MIPITLSAPGYATQTVYLQPEGAAGRDQAPPPAVASGPDFAGSGHNSARTGNYPAGGVHTFRLVIADSDTTADKQPALFMFGDAEGPAFKTVTLVGPGGITIPVGAANQNAASLSLAVNEPARGLPTLTTGEWVVRCLFHTPGAAVFTFDN